MRQLEEMRRAPTRFATASASTSPRYAFANATWTDLIRILDGQNRRGPRRLEPRLGGRAGPADDHDRPDAATATIASLTFTQADPRGRSLLWNQRLQVALGYDIGCAHQPAHDERAQRRAAECTRPARPPRYVLPNGEGVGYGLFRLDDRSRTFFLDQPARRWRCA